MAHLFLLGRAGLAVILCVGAASAPSEPAASGQPWAVQMFDYTSHDFGTVARGAKVEHRFRIENVYVEDVHIASVQSNSDAVTAHATKNLLKTWQRAEIVVSMDAEKFLGRKDATIEVKFDAPFEAEVRLQVHGETGAVAISQPAAVSVGCTGQGSGARQCVPVIYAGRCGHARFFCRFRRGRRLLGRCRGRVCGKYLWRER